MNSNARMRLMLGALAIVLTPVTAPAAETTSSGKPQYSTWGFDTAGGDKSTKPGDDFFRYANGHWLDTHQIPADKPAVSLRLEMTDRTEARLHEMMERSAAKASHRPGDVEVKVGTFYKAFMDERRVE